MNILQETDQTSSGGVSISKQINNFWQPQLVSIVVLTLILIVFTIVVYRKAKKQPKDKAPEGILLITEMYVKGVENMVQSNGDGKLNKSAPYIFTLLTFLLFGNIMGIIGFEPPVTSYAVPLSLGLITWIGIYVVGIYYNKWKFFKKYANPIEMVGQFSPLVSISVRIFGNIIAGSTLIYLIYYFSSYIWGFIPVIGQLNILGAFMAPALHGYFDIFGGLIQAYVFVSLTLAYWSGEIPVEEDKEQANSGTMSEISSRKFEKIKEKVALKK